MRMGIGEYRDMEKSLFHLTRIFQVSFLIFSTRGSERFERWTMNKILINLVERLSSSQSVIQCVYCWNWFLYSIQNVNCFYNILHVHKVWICGHRIGNNWIDVWEISIVHLSIMGSLMFLEMILASEPLPANWTRKRTKSRMDPLVTSQFLVTSERFATIWMVTSKRSLS